MPVSSYSFDPDIKEFLPFNEAELKLIKKYKIAYIIKPIDETLKNKFHFNNNGQLILEQEIWSKGKKHDTISKTIYKYNNNGDLIIKQYLEKRYEVYDSITYNEQGNLLAYYHHRKFLHKKKKKEYVEVDYNLQYLKSNEQHRFLIDSTIHGYEVLYKLNSKNEVISIESKNRIDTISYQYGENGELIKSYWYKFKSQKETTFIKGREVVYKDSLIQSKINFQRNGKVSSSFSYVYNPKKQLLRLVDDNPFKQQEFYTYNEWGLLRSIVSVNDTKAKIEYFQYSVY